MELEHRGRYMSMKRLLELKRKELISDVDRWTKDKARLVRRAQYQGVTENYTVFFRVPSVTSNPPTNYTVRINLADYADVAEDKDLTTQEKVRLAIAGDLKISCNCPAYLYFGYKYILTQLDTNASEDENRFPRIRNPKLQGVMCKHCYAAIQAFPFNWTYIARDIDQGRYKR